MVKSFGSTIVVSLGLAIALLWLGQSTALAQNRAGDCEGDGRTSIANIVRCTNIFLGNQPVENCPNCDQNGDGTVAMAEVVGAANCFSDNAADNCMDATPQPDPTTPVPTPTTPAPTEIDTPANTATPTDTATEVPPSDTPTDTPTETPTNTLVPTDTATPSPTNTVDDN